MSKHRDEEEEVYAIGKCHDCGKTTHNYRCQTCKEIYLRKHGIELHSINSINEDFAGVFGSGYGAPISFSRRGRAE